MNDVNLTAAQHENIAKAAIATAIKKNRNDVIALLKLYGVAVDKSNTDHQIIIAVLQVLRSRPAFKTQLTNLLTKVAQNNLQFADTGNFFSFNNGDTNAAGEYYYNGTWVDAGSYARIINGTQNDFANTSSSNALSNAGSSALGTIFSPTNIGNILNGAVNVLSTTLVNKSNQQLANTALQIEQQKTQQAALQAAMAGANVVGTKPGLSTGAKIGIGLGIAAVLGIVIYFIVRKK